jgi:hypothetical protein
MSGYADIIAALDGVAEATVRAGRRASSVDPAECDELLSAIIDAEHRMQTACAYLRRVARPESVTSSEDYSRIRETLDRMDIADDQHDADDDAEDTGDWAEFLATHPELLADAEPKPAPRIELDDDAIVLAVAEAARQLQEFRAAKPLLRDLPVGGIEAWQVADVLIGEPFGNGDRAIQPQQGDVIRIGQRLGKLARDGRLRYIMRPSGGSYGTKRYAPVETDDV